MTSGVKESGRGDKGRLGTAHSVDCKYMEFTWVLNNKNYHSLHYVSILGWSSDSHSLSPLPADLNPVLSPPNQNVPHHFGEPGY